MFKVLWTGLPGYIYFAPAETWDNVCVQRATKIDGPTCCTHAQTCYIWQASALDWGKGLDRKPLQSGTLLPLNPKMNWLADQSLKRGSLQPVSCICSLCTLQRSTADPGPLAHFQLPKRASADIEFLATCVCWEHSSPCLEKRLPAPAKEARLAASKWGWFVTGM